MLTKKSCSNWINTSLKSKFETIDAKSGNNERLYLSSLNEAQKIVKKKLEYKSSYLHDSKTGLNLIKTDAISYFFDKHGIALGWRVKNNARIIDHCP